ncbi:LOB domain-containing protein 40-like [Andrographis paniculata]|uniref:LOB domain-containing protein 40-like n=1 Tax=Andrographis paniculata TaxID=175694 RepID=UPI0021E92A33|nr:LOB domain-containing protein 40-like [Andrographis paniculata]
MRLSCSGCRVLRKGCSDDCSIRPCLEWIKSAESQANATVFLAKFYGRAGLTNLINAGPPHLRPAIFKSLLYEACGRIVNPIYGSVGLMWSRNWDLCQAAVEAVLSGAEITPMATDAAAEAKIGKAYDIRHVNKQQEDNLLLHRVRSRGRFKRSGPKPKPGRVCVAEDDSSHSHSHCRDEAANRSPSHGSSLSHQSEPAAGPAVDRASESLGSAETAEPEASVDAGEEIELDLTLSLEPPVKHCAKPKAN